jgi:hypothetical protein
MTCLRIPTVRDTRFGYNTRRITSGNSGEMAGWSRRSRRKICARSAFDHVEPHETSYKGNRKISTGNNRRDGRVVEGTPLLREHRFKRLIEGSNPSLSAN